MKEKIKCGGWNIVSGIYVCVSNCICEMIFHCSSLWALGTELGLLGLSSLSHMAGPLIYIFYFVNNRGSIRTDKGELGVGM